MGWLAGWAIRFAITIDNAEGAAAAAAQVRVTLGSPNFSFAQARSDGADLRFTDSDGTTLLNHWAQSYSSADNLAVCWVKTALPAAGSKTIYLYCGRSDASDVSSYDDTMVGIPSDDDGLIALYRFADGSGDTIADATGNGHFATLSGSPTWLEEEVGNFGKSIPPQLFAAGRGMTFANGQYAQCYPASHQPDSGTVMFWLRINNVAAYTNAFNPIYEWRSDDNNNQSIYVAVGADNKPLLTLNTQNAGTNLYAQSFGGEINLWNNSDIHHVAVTWSKATSTWRCYVDGALVLQTAQAIDNSSVTNSFFVHSFNGGGFTGSGMSIGELAFYDRELSRDEIAARVERRTHIAGRVSVHDRLIRSESNPILVATESYETNGGDHVSEPAVFVELATGKPAMIYESGYWGVGVLALARNPSGDGVTWVKEGQISAGTLGVHPYVYVENGTYYLFGADPNNASVLALSTSADLETWSTPAAVDVGAWYSQVANTCVVKVGATYYLMVEALDSNSELWQPRLYSSTSLTANAWTQVTADLSSLQIGRGMYGGPDLHYLPASKMFINCYHYGPNANLNTYCAIRGSYDLQHWFDITTNPAIEFYLDGRPSGTLSYGQDNQFQTQVADSCVLEFGGKTFWYFSTDDDFTTAADIRVATFDRSLEQLVAADTVSGFPSSSTANGGRSALAFLVLK
jgi:hypothetical protein